MDASIPTLRPELLLEHEGFVRSVARGLLADAHAAEDVAQETWLTAWLHGPRSAGALRTWLVSVARNRARDWARGEARRASRERLAARAEAFESVDATCERLAAQREVVAAILALDEPYRGVVLLRYYHDLEPAEIAARLGAKPATVRTQLSRAHELLRAKLDARYGRREAWAALVLPAALPGKGLASSLKVAALGIGAAGAAALVWSATQGNAGRAGTDALVATLHASVEAASVPVELAPSEPLERARVEVTVPAGPAAEPQVGPPVRETRLPRAELFDQVAHGRDRAFFSFEFGLRDDPGFRRTRRDWELAFQGNQFNVITIVDDHSHIVDLGEVPLTAVGQLGDRPSAERVPAMPGHSYFVWTRDYDTDLAAAFEVVELVPGDRCVLEWYATKGDGAALGSLHDESGGRLAGKLLALRRELRARNPLRAPRVVLQVRAGAGNPCRIDMAGERWKYIDEVSSSPLDLLTPIDMREKSVAYFEGGFIPEDKVFVVERARYSGVARGDSSGHGEFKVVLQGTTIFESGRIEAEEEEKPVIDERWTGRVVVQPGDEVLTYLEVANSSGGEVVFEGELVGRE